ncbi:hypothetical protein THAOC_17665, partial [Thalassiosira oceanica]
RGGVRTPRRSAAGSARQSPAGHPSDAAILATDGGGAAAAEPETTNPGSPPAARASALDFPFGRFGPRAPAGRAGGQPAGVSRQTRRGFRGGRRVAAAAEVRGRGAPGRRARGRLPPHAEDPGQVRRA